MLLARRREYERCIFPDTGGQEKYSNDTLDIRLKVDIIKVYRKNPIEIIGNDWRYYNERFNIS